MFDALQGSSLSWAIPGTCVVEDKIAVERRRSVARKAWVAGGDAAGNLLRHVWRCFASGEVEDIGRMRRGSDGFDVGGQRVEAGREGVAVVDHRAVDVLLRVEHQPVASPPGRIEARGVMRLQK